LDHLCKVVIPLAAMKTIPGDAPEKLPTAPDVHTLGTLSAIGEELKMKGLSEIAQFKEKGMEERDRREEEGLGERWADRQRVVRPDIDNHFIGFRIEMLFHYMHGQECIWCHGEVIAIKNAKKKTVKVRWAEEHVAEGESCESYHILQDSKWNITKSIFNIIVDCLAAIIIINSSECMKRYNIHVLTEGIALGGEYEAIKMWLYGVTGKSIVSHQSVTSQSLVRNTKFRHYTP
jgi:hypothetical protein